MDVKRHNGNVLPKKPRTLVRGFLIFHGYARCATKTGKSPSSNDPASDVRIAVGVAVLASDSCRVVYGKCIPQDYSRDSLLLKGDIHREKTAEEQFNMLARGWLAYPMTPVARATTAEVRL